MSKIEEYERYLKKCEMLGTKMFEFNSKFNGDSTSIVITRYIENKEPERLISIPDFVSMIVKYAFVNVKQKVTIVGEGLKGVYLSRYMGDSIDLKGLDTSKIVDMNSMFRECRNIKELDLSNFDTGSVNSMISMFDGCRNLKELNVGSFNTVNVTDMSIMFSDCEELEKLDLSSFDTSNVTEMSFMFYRCNKLKELNISNFSANKLRNKVCMFMGCDNLKIIRTNKEFKTILEESRRGIELNIGCEIVKVK